MSNKNESITINSDTFVETEEDPALQNQHFIKGVTQPKEDKISDHNLMTTNSDGATKEDDIEIVEEWISKARRDVLWKNFVRLVKKHYIKAFKRYKDTHMKKLKTKPSSGQIFEVIQNFWQENLKSFAIIKKYNYKINFEYERGQQSIPIYLYAMINKDQFITWKK